MDASSLKRLAAWIHSRGWLWAAGRLVAIGLILGWLYGWIGSRLYPSERIAGFGWGMAHGACMPLALPALLMGKDVSIYAERNTGRSYKLGYIAGINLCGLVVFGGAFWKPRQVAPSPAQSHQER